MASDSKLSISVDLPNGASMSVETTINFFYEEPFQKVQELVKYLLETAMEAEGAEQ